MGKIRQVDIAIVGTGIVGLALAVSLAQSTPFKVLLIGARPKETEDGHRVSALNVASQTMLTKLGVWAQLAGHVAAYDQMKIYEQSAQLPSLHLTAGAHQVPHLGFIVNHYQLRQALVARYEALTSGQWLEMQSESWDQAQQQLTLVDGTQVKATCIVAADGRTSSLREASGIDCMRHDYHQQAIVATLKLSKSHQFTCYQRFLQTGPLAFLPLHDPNTVSCVWSLDQAAYDAKVALSDDAFGQAITQALNVESMLGAACLASKRLCYPLIDYHADRYYRPGLVLVGDAAHGVHPLAGMGLNLGLKDAAVLAAVLSDFSKKEVGSVACLDRYQRARRGENDLVIKALRHLATAFVSQSGFWPHLRQHGLACLNQSTIFQGPLVRYALGL